MSVNKQEIRTKQLELIYQKELMMKKLLFALLFAAIILPQSAFAIGCPYVIKVRNHLPSAANLLELKSRIRGLSWAVIENFENEGIMVKNDTNWSDDYRTASFCNTTKHDFQLKFRNAQNNIVIKNKEAIKVKNGSTVTFTLGK
ncbi:MAG: hypothetical protein ABW092_19805 [Candidatus Thiodiazotropha sp.]